MMSMMIVGNLSKTFFGQKLAFWLTVGVSSLLFLVGQLDLADGWRSILCLNIGGIGLISCLGFSELGRRFDHREMEQLRSSSTTDVLTGVGNKKFFDQEIARRVTQLRRYNTSCSLLLIDADYFRTINSTWGRDVGDQALKALVRAITATLRDIDLVFRIDGQRFAALLPETQANNAAIAAERVRVAISELQVPAINRHIQISVSIGGAELLTGENAKSWYRRADNTLFEAKQSGRNRVLFDYQSNAPIADDELLCKVEFTQP
jgi:diguanylate cyclase (GGDEF)-like protein